MLHEDKGYSSQLIYPMSPEVVPTNFLSHDAYDYVLRWLKFHKTISLDRANRFITTLKFVKKMNPLGNFHSDYNRVRY